MTRRLDGQEEMDYPMCATTRFRLRFPPALPALVGLIGALLVSASSGAAQQALPARLVNARTETRSAAPGLEKTVRAIASVQEEPAWIGYALPATPGRHQMCCGSYRDDSETCCGRCQLENERHGDGVSVKDNEPSAVKLEAAPVLLVLYRVAGKKIGKIRVFSPECELDAGGRTVYWLTDVQPPESVRWLASLVNAGDSDHHGDDDDGAPHLTDGALAAIAFHADPEADAALERFAAAR